MDDFLLQWLIAFGREWVREEVLKQDPRYTDDVTDALIVMGHKAGMQGYLEAKRIGLSINVQYRLTEKGFDRVQQVAR